jgi:Flp pilus assembly pilin Flp
VSGALTNVNASGTRCFLVIMKSILSRLAHDDSGQDIVEYALLAAFFGVVGYLVMPLIVTEASNTYTTWKDPATGVPSLWDPPAPAGS